MPTTRRTTSLIQTLRQADPVGGLAFVLLLAGEGPDDPRIAEARERLPNADDRRMLFDLTRPEEWGFTYKT